MVVAPRGFRDEELFVPRGRFEAEGATVEVASPEPGHAQGMLGAEIAPDLLVKDVEAARYVAIVVVGGRGAPEALWENGPLHALLRTAARAGTVVAAICLAPVALARAGLLAGVRATVFADPGAKKEMLRGGALFIDDDVVVDRTVVTASGPDAARAFADAIIRVLRGAAAASSVSRGRGRR
jgi:protease I